MSVLRKTKSFIFAGILKSMAGYALVFGAIQYVVTQLPGSSISGPIVFNILIFAALAPIMVTANFAGFIKLYSGRVSMGIPFDDHDILHNTSIISVMMFGAGLLLFGGIGLIVSNHIWAGLILICISGLVIWIIIRKSQKLYSKIIDESKQLISNDDIDTRDVFKASNKMLLLGALAVGLGGTGIYLIGWEKQLLIGILVLIGMLILLWILKRNVNDAVQKLGLPSNVEVSNWMRF